MPRIPTAGLNAAVAAAIVAAVMIGAAAYVLSRPD